MCRSLFLHIILPDVFIDLFGPFPDIPAAILKIMHPGSQFLRNSRFNLLPVDFGYDDCRYPVIEDNLIPDLQRQDPFKYRAGMTNQITIPEEVVSSAVEAQQFDLLSIFMGE